MFMDSPRPFAAVAAGLLTAVLFVWIDGAMPIRALQTALIHVEETRR